MRAEYSGVIIGSINSLDFDGLAAEVLKLQRQLFFNGFCIFIFLLANRLRKAFASVFGGTLGRMEPRYKAGDGAEED